MSTKLQIEFPPLRWNLLSLATVAQGSFSLGCCKRTLRERERELGVLLFLSSAKKERACYPASIEVSAKAGLEAWSSFAWEEG